MRRPRRLLFLAAACLLFAPSCGKRRSPPPSSSPSGPLRLAFRTNMLTFNLAVGERASREVRLAGVAGISAKLAIVSVEGRATAELLPAGPEPTAGVRLSFVATQPGEGEGAVTVTTGLAPPVAPKRLVLFYSWKVD